MARKVNQQGLSKSYVFISNLFSR